MKAKDLLERAEGEIKTDEEKAVVEQVKESLMKIKGCKKTLRLLEKKHKKLLETDIDDLETENLVY